MTDLHALLDRLAVPRLVGSSNHARVRELLRAELERRGCVVMEHPFTASPVRLVAAQVWGAGVGVVIFGTLLLAPSRLPVLWAAAWACAGAAVLAAYPFLPLLWRLPVPTTPATNLIGVRPGDRVRVWLAAHFDSKGQRLSMLSRLLAVGLCVGGLIGVVAIVGLRTALGWRPLWGALAIPGAIGALLLARCRTRDDSPGAVDNATGVLTVLAVLDALPPAAPVGVLFLDAEEFGLEGARALVRERANLLHGTAVVNFDGDRGGARVGRPPVARSPRARRRHRPREGGGGVRHDHARGLGDRPHRTHGERPSRAPHAGGRPGGRRRRCRCLALTRT